MSACVLYTLLKHNIWKSHLLFKHFQVVEDSIVIIYYYSLSRFITYSFITILILFLNYNDVIKILIFRLNV